MSKLHQHARRIEPRAVLLGGAAIALCAMQHAYADQEILAEIVVTAQNREQKLTDVPLAITVVPASRLEENHIKDFSDVASLAPNFVSGSNYGYIRNSSMRGISNNAFGFADDPSIAMFVDDVYQGRGSTGMQVNALYDVDRLEVIKGPQATLFGRSSIGGAMSVINNMPTNKQSASLDLGFGERNRVLARGMINWPVSDRLAVRAAFNSEDQHGYIKNLNGGTLEPLDDKAARIIAKYTGDPLTATYLVSYERRRQNGSTPQEVGLPDFTADLTTVGDQNFADFDIFQTWLKLEYPFGDHVTLTSNTSYRNVKNSYLEDYDAVPQVIGGPYTQHSEEHLLQQDLKVGYQDGDLSLTVGGSWFDDDLDAFIDNWVDQTFAFTGSGAFGLTLPAGDYSHAFYEQGRFDGHFNGWSVFADGTVPLLPGLTATAGVRYNYDRKEFESNIPDPAVLPENVGRPVIACACYNWGFWTSAPMRAEKSWDNLSYRAAMNYKLSSDHVVYVQFSQGWKSGGIDTFKLGGTAPGFTQYFGQNATPFGLAQNVYDPEFSNSYEAGIKGALLSRTLQYEVAVYRYMYRDLQVAMFEQGKSTIRNIGRARGAGVEVNLNYHPTPGWAIFANGAYNRTKILSFEADPSQVGLPLNQAPRYTSAAGATYTADHAFGVPGSIFVGGNLTQRSDFRTDNVPENLAKGFVLFNLRTGYRSADERYSVTLFADNVFDKFTYNRPNPVTPFTYPVDRRSVIGPPRTIGVDLHVDF